MPKHKMITKSCRKCSLQVPVACKACPCGHPFLTGQRRSGGASEMREQGAVQRRRTERVKREKPNYYDALEYDKQMKKAQRKRNRSSTEEHGEPAEEANQGLKKKQQQQQQQQQRKRAVKTEKEPEEDTVINTLSPEKGYKCSLILSEINRKICLTSWRV